MNYQELLKKYVVPIVNKISNPKPDDVLEIEAYDGFDDKDPHETLKSIISLLSLSGLEDDPQWHFFFEGDFTVFRFSRKFASKIESALYELGTKKYIGPQEWKEGTYITRRFQYTFFVKLFHLISEGAILLLLDKEKDKDFDYYIRAVAERMIHAWFNHNACSEVVFGKNIESLDKCQAWEGLVVSGIASDRMYFAGRYEYIKSVQKKFEDKNNKKQNQENIL
jgi:hypothetical protein